jgi:BirA family transcriptional regulator, biotin operon repressor / biotin---[acetyl-CoA-carboxylase] ligase
VSRTAPREWYAEIPSTQDRAIALARSGAPAGTRVVAGRQTRGRGRLDHAWASPPGGLYLSLLLPSPAGHDGLLPLAIGAHLAAALEQRFGLRLALKWPNDLFVVRDGAPPRKISGVLLDRIPVPGGGFTVVAGIGVNVAPAPPLPPDVAPRAVALGDLVTPPPSVGETEELVVRAAEAAAASFDRESELDATRAMCRDRLYGVGRRATVDGVPVGTIAGLGDEGELWVNAGGERVAIRAGDLRLEESV